MNYPKSRRGIYNKLIIPTLINKGFEVDSIKDNIEIIIDGINTTSIDMIIYSFKYNLPLITIQWCTNNESCLKAFNKAIIISELVSSPFAMATDGVTYYVYNRIENRKDMYIQETLPNKAYFESFNLECIYSEIDWGEGEETLDINSIMMQLIMYSLLGVSLFLCFISVYFIIISLIVLSLNFEKRNEVIKYNPKIKNYLYLNVKKND